MQLQEQQLKYIFDWRDFEENIALCFPCSDSKHVALETNKQQ